MGSRMASHNIFLACMYLAFNFSVYRYAAAGSTEIFDENPIWKMAVEKISQLEKLVKEQDKRISALEKRPTESELRSLTEELQNQSDRIIRLEARILKLEVPSEDETNELANQESSVQVSELIGKTLNSRQDFPQKSTF